MATSVFQMPHCINAAKPAQPCKTVERPATPAQEVGYHLIIYDFRSINHLINKNRADFRM